MQPVKTLAIIGSSEFADQIAHLAPVCGYRVAGFFDDFKPAGRDGDKVILGALAEVEVLYRQQRFDAVVVAIGYKHFVFRDQVFSRVSAAGIPCATLVHPSCVVDATASIGPGAVLYPGSVIDKGVKIGANVLVNLACVIAHDSCIGDHSFLSPGVALAGFCRVGARNFIGINATVIDGITLADDVFLGGGAVVVSDIREAGVYVGNPARRLRR